MPVLALNRTYFLIACAIGVLWAVGSSAAAQTNVRFEVDSRETGVHVPVHLVIAIENAREFARPTLPEIDGAAVQPTPSERRASQASIINGVMTQTSTVTLTYRIVPSRVGLMTIPPITVVADGKTFTSQPIDIVVGDADAGDLLFAEIHADRETVYVGQPVNLLLRVWIRPYQDRGFEIRLDGSDMWNMIDLRASTWGPFAEVLSTMRDPFGRLQLRIKEELRKGDDGATRSYYLYELPATIWPQQPGPLALDQPNIVVNYPVRLRRDDTLLFGGRLSVAATRGVAAQVSPPPVTVLAPPVQGQPSVFTGAVGTFEMVVSAKPTEVAVGDPITLTIAIADRTDEGVQMELLQPPALNAIPELASNFRLPPDALAGTVIGRTKTFTQTIRATSDQVTRIPPIHFAFFNPDAQQYVTVSSEPIALHVKPASTLAQSAVIASPGAGSTHSSATQLTEVAGGILANAADPDALLASHEFAPAWPWYLALVASPVLFAVALARTVAARSSGRDASRVRRRQAARRAHARLKDARGHQPTAGAIKAILSEYVADRLDLPAGSLTRAQVVAHLQRSGVSESDIATLDELLGHCEHAVYAGGGEHNASELSSRAAASIKALEKHRWR